MFLFKCCNKIYVQTEYFLHIKSLNSHKSHKKVINLVKLSIYRRSDICTNVLDIRTCVHLWFVDALLFLSCSSDIVLSLQLVPLGRSITRSSKEKASAADSTDTSTPCSSNSFSAPASVEAFDFATLLQESKCFQPSENARKVVEGDREFALYLSFLIFLNV